MTRSLGLALLVLSLAIGGYLLARQATTAGPTSAAAQRAETQAAVAAAATSFDSALPALQAWFADHGTYAGATLPPSYGVTVVRADGVSYCLQSGDRHETGPGGSPASGPC
jgi:hypothetical protein